MPKTVVTFDLSEAEWADTVKYLEALHDDALNSDASLPNWLLSSQERMQFKRRLGLIGSNKAKFVWNGQEVREISPQHGDRIFVPRFDAERRNNIISRIHVNLRHVAWGATYQCLKEKYANITESDVRTFVNECIVCIQNSNVRSDRKDIQPVLACRPNMHWQIDLVDMKRYADQNDGYKWILCVVDVFSKFMWTYPVFAKEPSQVNVCLWHLFEANGVPRIIQSDNGREFENEETRRFFSVMHVEFRHGLPRKPSTQGQIERANQTIVSRRLRKALLHDRTLGDAPDAEDENIGLQDGSGDNSSGDSSSNEDSGQHDTRWVDTLFFVTRAYNACPHRAFGQKYCPHTVHRGYPDPFYLDNVSVEAPLDDAAEETPSAASAQLSEASQAVPPALVAGSSSSSSETPVIAAPPQATVADLSADEVQSRLEDLADDLFEARRMVVRQAAEHQQRYVEQYVRAASVHTHKNPVRVGSAVAIRPNRTANGAHQQFQLENTYSLRGTVLSIKGNNTVEVELSVPSASGAIRLFPMRNVKVLSGRAAHVAGVFNQPEALSQVGVKRLSEHGVADKTSKRAKT
ncbi:MAG: integrase [Polynucleobacter sp.]|nr:integrase [Polynucleobacter sp.]